MTYLEMDIIFSRFLLFIKYDPHPMIVFVCLFFDLSGIDLFNVVQIQAIPRGPYCCHCTGLHIAQPRNTIPNWIVVHNWSRKILCEQCITSTTDSNVLQNIGNCCSSPMSLGRNSSLRQRFTKYLQKQILSYMVL